jgi:hypothetical protein
LLEHYAVATRMFSIMEERYRRSVAKGLYNQLVICGPLAGDSWYTTEKVYAVWGWFNEAPWSYLKHEVERHAIREGNVTWCSARDQAILDDLAPAADHRSFILGVHVGRVLTQFPIP